MEQTPDSLRSPQSAPEPPEWHRTGALAMRAALEAGQLSSLELATAHLARIAEVDPEICAFAEVTRDEALRAATRSDDERRAGESRGPLHGLPIALDECFDLAGRPTTLGLASRQGVPAARDSDLARALLASGAVLLGRTNTSQLLLSVESDNPVFGRTSNPFSPRHAGGGAAAAVAAGLTPVAFSSDQRIAAHFCGVAALVPSLGRLLNRDRFGRTSILARNVADIEVGLDALPANALAAIDARIPPFVDAPAPPLRGLTVGVLHDSGVMPPSSALIGALERAGDALRAAGVRVEAIAVPDLAELFFAAFELWLADGGRGMIDALTDESVTESLRTLHKLVRAPRAVRAGLERIAKLSGDGETARLIGGVGEKTATELRALEGRLDAIRRTMLETWQKAGLAALLCPPYATPAVPHGGSADLLIASSYSLPWTALGLPAGVVPVTRVHGAEARRDHARGRIGRLARRVDEQSAGLPVGVQLVAPPWRDRTLLALMEAVERNVRADVDYPRTPVW